MCTRFPGRVLLCVYLSFWYNHQEHPYTLKSVPVWMVNFKHTPSRSKIQQPTPFQCCTGLEAPSGPVSYSSQRQNETLQKKDNGDQLMGSWKPPFQCPVTSLVPSSRNWKELGNYEEPGQIINKHLWLKQQYFECFCKHGSLPMKFDLL